MKEILLRSPMPKARNLLEAIEMRPWSRASGTSRIGNRISGERKSPWAEAAGALLT
jgi:hypothetical protein